MQAAIALSPTPIETILDQKLNFVEHERKIPEIVQVSGRVFQVQDVTWGKRNPKDIERFLINTKRDGDWLIYQDSGTQETWFATYGQGMFKKAKLTHGNPPPPESKEPILAATTWHQQFLDLKDSRILSPEQIQKNLIKQREDAEEAQLHQKTNTLFSQLMISRKKVNYEYTSKKGNPSDLKTMAEPVQVLGMRVGIASCKGLREKMEDAHLAKEVSFDIAGKEHKAALYGVFDGHRGPACARFLADHMENTLKARLTDLTDAGICTALQQAFHDLKKSLLEKGYQSGSTASVVLVLPKEKGGMDIFCANAGDSRALIEEEGKALPLSMDAKPWFQKFHKGIIARGGYVSQGRVMRTLAVARGFEGSPLVSGPVSARPKIIKRSIEPGSDQKKRLLIACDGLFDVCSSAQAAKQLPFMHDAKQRPNEMAKHLLSGAYAAGSTDNITAMVVDLT
ncbi:MAG: protein phosphatase 2C domain-containing protein [Parachlamydia sp.]|nr:protein phosphatase 2C domain-containing protein [Parachlamydia sp.]